MAAYERPGFVALVVGSDDKPLKEIGEEGKRTVRIPFGSEYKLRFKNTTNARAYVRVEIDGMDALSGKKLIMEPNCTKDLERFIQGDNSRGSKFKFVEAGNAGVTDPTARENGLVRVIFEPEAIPIVTTVIGNTGGFVTKASYGGMSGGMSGGGGGVLRGMAMSCTNGAVGISGGAGSATGGGTAHVGISNVSCVGAAYMSAPASGMSIGYPLPVDLPGDLGATAAGSMSGQKFQDTNEFFYTLAPVTLDIWIKGLKMDQPLLPWVIKQHRGGIAQLWHGPTFISALSQVNMSGPSVHLVSDTGKQNWQFGPGTPWELQVI